MTALDGVQTLTTHAQMSLQALKMCPEMMRFLQEEGWLLVFSSEIERCWTKPNVQGSAPLSSLELRFEDTWLS